MELDLTLALIFQHLLVALLPWLMVMVVGGGLGYLLATLTRRYLEKHQWLLDFLVLIPWRSAGVWVALVVIDTPLMVMRFGLGTISAAISVGLALSLIILSWVTETRLRAWYPLSLPGKYLSIARLTAVLALAFPVLNNSGVGYFIWRATSELAFQKMSQGYAALGAMLLGADLLLGLIQFAVISRASGVK